MAGGVSIIFLSPTPDFFAYDSIIIDLPGNAMYILYHVSYDTPSLGSTLILARKNLDVYVHFIQNSKYI